MAADVWMNFNCMAGWGMGSHLLRQLRDLDPSVTKIRLLLGSMGYQRRRSLAFAQVLRALRERGVVVRVVVYSRVGNASIAILQAASPGERVMLRGSPLSFNLAHLRHDDTPVPLAPLLRQLLQLALMGAELSLEDMRGMVQVVRQFEDEVREVLPVTRRQMRAWSDDPYISPAAIRTRDHWFTQLMDDHRESWESTMAGLPCVFIDEEIVERGWADRVVDWGEAFDD